MTSSQFIRSSLDPVLSATAGQSQPLLHTSHTHTHTHTWMGPVRQLPFIVAGVFGTIDYAARARATLGPPDTSRNELRDQNRASSAHGWKEHKNVSCCGAPQHGENNVLPTAPPTNATVKASISCSIVQLHAISCDSVQYRAISCNQQGVSCCGYPSWYRNNDPNECSGTGCVHGGRGARAEHCRHRAVVRTAHSEPSPSSFAPRCAGAGGARLV